MKSKEQLNKQYANLCARLGDLLMNKEKIEQSIDEVRSQIEVLNKTVPVAEAVERMLRLELTEKDKQDIEKTNERE